MKPVLAVVALSLLLLCCKDKGGGTSATNAIGKLTEFKTAMCACKDEACAKKVSDEMAAWGREQPTTNPAMSADDQKRANDIGRELGDCLLRVMSARDAAGSVGSANAGSGSASAPSGSASAAAAPPATGSATGSAGALPKECDEYKAVVAKIQTCEKMSKSARETLVKGYEEASTRWTTLNEASRASLAEACRGGTDAVAAAGKTQCGW